MSGTNRGWKRAPWNLFSRHPEPSGDRQTQPPSTVMEAGSLWSTPNFWTRAAAGRTRAAAGRTQAAAGMNRRQLLGALGLGGMAAALWDFLPAMATNPSNDASDPVFLLVCTFEGGWDQLLALDPRDNTAYQDESGSIFPAYHLCAQTDATLSALLSSNPSGLVKPEGSNITFGPAIGRLAENNLYQDLCVLRGINMGTLTHEVGRRYFLTGKFPRGLSANGSALASWVCNSVGELSLVPNLVLGTETFAEGLSDFASGLVVQTSTDLQTVLTPLGAALPTAQVDAIDQYLLGYPDRCRDLLLNHSGQTSQFLSARTRAETMVSQNLGAYFNFGTTPTPEQEELYAAFRISSTANTASQQLAGAAGQAMIAAQALTHGVSQAVSIKLADGIDTHDDDYLTDHCPALRTGFDALADLIGWLKKQTYTPSGKSYWEHTLLLVSSDFARTPALNSRSGRDHHLASSCLVGGRGIKGNQVIGATDNSDMLFQGIDLQTGAVVGANGWVMRPQDIHASLLYAAGLPYSHLSNQAPELIYALKR